MAVATTEAPKRQRDRESTIPEDVSKRMVKRMAAFSGIPTALGVATFVVCYLLVIQGGLDVPTSAVVLVSMGFFGLGVLGLSYGILSASWEEGRPGSFLGWEDFRINFDRMVAAWREARQEAQRNKS